MSVCSAGSPGAALPVVEAALDQAADGAVPHLHRPQRAAPPHRLPVPQGGQLFVC